MSFQNNLAYMLGQKRIWDDGFYAGTFSEYDFVRDPCGGSERVATMTLRPRRPCVGRAKNWRLHFPSMRDRGPSELVSMVKKIDGYTPAGATRHPKFASAARP